MRKLLSSTALQRSSNLAGLRIAVEYVPVARLKQPPHATRRHPKQQIRRIARSIVEHGFLVPVTVYADNVIASGAARVAAASLAGLNDVPVIRIEHLTDEQARLFAIADNKLAEGASWDLDALRVEFGEIALASPEIDLDGSGFSIGERDVLVGRHRTDELADLDDRPEAAVAAKAVSRLGDVWRLGRHRLVCGDAQDAGVLAAAVDGQPVRTVLSDLPYNVKIAGNVSGLGETVHGEFAMASGEMTKPQFGDFLTGVIAAMQPHMVDGGLAYLFMDWRHIDDLIGAAARCDLAYLNLLVWAKTNAGMGSHYRSAHELIGLFKSGGGKHTNTVQLGAHGRNRKNVLHYPGVNTFTKGRKAALKLHPTVKPVALIADLILDSSAPGEVILDPFGGSGTTLIAAEKTDRTAALVEISPAYVDVTIRRFEAATGEQAVLDGDGRAFAEITAERADAGGEA
ncbi:MAG: DNA modification methylase [Rhizorhabdus sp.]